MDLAFNDAAKLEHFHNTAAGIRRLVQLLRARPSVRIVVEATRGYEEAVFAACAIGTGRKPKKGPHPYAAKPLSHVSGQSRSPL